MDLSDLLTTTPSTQITLSIDNRESSSPNLDDLHTSWVVPYESRIGRKINSDDILLW